MFTGNYKDIVYSIEFKQDQLLGAYYDIRLIIGEKIIRAKELNPIRAIDTLAQCLKAWVIEEELIVVTPEKAQELIKKWNELSKQVDHNNWVNDQDSQASINEMLPILMELREAGYVVTDDGQWYHPSEAN